MITTIDTLAAAIILGAAMPVTVTISRRNEHGEYRVKIAGRPEADYFTDDLQDARGTAHEIASQWYDGGIVQDRTRRIDAVDTAYAPRAERFGSMYTNRYE